MKLFRQSIARMSPYVPGAQPPRGAKVVKLNTNENPYPPSPRAMELLRATAADELRLYPDAMATRFREAVAGVIGFGTDWILPGNGSDDLIMMIARAAAGPGRAIAYPTPTFTFYATQAHIENAPRVEVPFDEDYRLPVDALASAGAAVVFVANPNSPSATAAATGELGELAGRVDGLLVIDEAYVDFAEADALELVRRHENVVILRTLSKGYSLAGLRLGYAVARPAVIEGLAKAKQIYNVGAVPAAVGAAAIADQDWKNANAGKVKASRAKLAGELERQGFRVWPPQANFVMAQVPSGRAGGDAGALHEALKARGILVRHFRTDRLRDKLRITVGTDEQNAALLDALREMTA